MTMFCPACEEDVTAESADGICLTCGEELIFQPTNTSTGNNNGQQHQTAQPRDDAAATTAMALLASAMENATAINPQSLLPLMNQLQGSNPNDDPLTGIIGTNGTNNNDNNINDLSGILPPEALNPQAASARIRPVSQAALDNLKRVVLTPQSSELFDAQISLFEQRSINDLSPCIVSNDKQDGKCLTLNAVPGEFGPLSSTSSGCSIKNGSSSNNEQNTKARTTAAIVVCSPLTTKGGKLSTETLLEIENLRKHRLPFIAYVERGDGITFVQKALVCQHAGEATEKESTFCVGVIVGNTASSGGKEVWPYVMQDTKNEATKFGLKIPVVMVKRDDGMKLKQWLKRNTDSKDKYTPCQMNIHTKQANSHTCPVCTDSYAPGDTIIRLPKCGHVFHEKCALAWLTKHNTCPYCRKELPTDDDDYERERRRREANSGDASGQSNGHNFYG